MSTLLQPAKAPGTSPLDTDVLGAQWPPPGGEYAASPMTGQIIARAASPGFDSWWSRLAGVGYCARPIDLSGRRADGSRIAAMARCKNRRAAVCPSCSHLYAGDTWHLVHAGAAGDDSLGIPASVGEHPMVFATLTAPSFGPVHTARKGATGGARRCHGDTVGRRCPHGTPLWCTAVHERHDPALGQPLCGQCYDYRGHIDFTWHAPALWHRFTIALRRLLARHLKAAGVDPKTVRVGYVKVVEMQARAIPHFHALIRLDNNTTTTARGDAPEAPAAPIDAIDLAALVTRAAYEAHLNIPPGDTDPNAGEGAAAAVRFGEQTDAQPVSADTAPVGGTDNGNEGGGWNGRKIAGYLAKYVTKSIGDFGIGHHRLSPHAIPTLNVSPHIRRLLTTITELATTKGRADMLARLHTLGYRGHITTKTRRYSTTMGVLRARRLVWRKTTEDDIAALDNNANHGSGNHRHDAADEQCSPTAGSEDSDDDEEGGIEWEFLDCGHRTPGERLLAVTAALSAREHHHTAREALREQQEAAS